LKIAVVGHVISEIGLTRSLAAGQISLEHAGGLVELPVGARMAERLGEWLGDSTPPRPEWNQGARQIARAGAWVGTIISSRDGLCGAPTYRSRHVIAALLRENVRLLAGADAGIGPVRARTGLHCELRTLVAAGLTPYQALITATANPGAFASAHLSSTSTFGTVTVGARADLVLLSKDPRADIRAVEKPVTVIVRGRVGSQVGPTVAHFR
jgi:hypothetical protein